MGNGRYGRSDIDAAVERMASVLGAKKELKNLASHLWDNELVDSIVAGRYGGGMGILVLTNARVVFLKHGITKQVAEDFPLDGINSVQWNAGMLMGKITLFVSGNKSEIDNIDKQTGKAMADTIRAHMSSLSKQAPPPAQAPAASAAVPASSTSSQPPADPVAVLAQLKKMLDSGLIAQQEFDTKKADILSRM